jgi:hypothetical protein
MSGYTDNFAPWSAKFLPKAKQHITKIDTYAIGEAHFTATPYEIDNPTLWDIPSYPARLRPDFKLLSAQTTGFGWGYTWSVRATKYRRQDFQANMGLQGNLTEYVDDYIGGSNGRKKVATGWFKGFIKDDGGVVSKRGDDGEDSLHITAATPDFWLANVKLGKLPYMNRLLAEEERELWSAEERTSSALGYQPIGSGPPTGDPLGGFGAYVDNCTTPIGELLVPRAANENHIIFPLSVSHALKELMCNHVFVNGMNLPWMFPIQMLVGQDGESNLVQVEYGPGTVQDAILEASRHGLWRYWWDAQCIMHFFRDYSCYKYSDNLSLVAMVIADGISMAGNLEISLGPKKLRLNRTAVEGQWSAGDATAEATPLENHFNAGVGSVYPPGRTPGGEGTDVEFKGYQGTNTAQMARNMYAYYSRRTTATISNFPWPSLAMPLYNRVIGIACKDPMGSWDFRPGATSPYYIDLGFDGGDKMTTYSAHGKLFSVDDISIQVQDPDGKGGGVPLATLTCTEIIPADCMEPLP